MLHKLFILLSLLGTFASTPAFSDCEQLVLPRQTIEAMRASAGYGFYAHQKFLVEILVGHSTEMASMQTRYYPFGGLLALLKILKPKALVPRDGRTIEAYYPFERDLFFNAVARGTSIADARYYTRYHPFPREIYLIQAFRGYTPSVPHYYPPPEVVMFGRMAKIPGMQMAPLLFAYQHQDGLTGNEGE